MALKGFSDRQRIELLEICTPPTFLARKP